ncbi:MAG: preprotein translocase subunit YajC [Planctomycetaceae bacterium]|nr:preprotein translocase subunit YajC [Planctomycetaceae bacterium]
MGHSWAVFTLLAQAADKGDDGDSGSILAFIIPMVIIFFLYTFLFNSPGKERKRQQKLIESMKKNDRVVTIGGIIGTVASISQDGSEVTLKIDDNARIKMLGSAIREVLTDKSDKDGS